MILEFEFQSEYIHTGNSSAHGFCSFICSIFPAVSGFQVQGTAEVLKDPPLLKPSRPSSCTTKSLDDVDQDWTAPVGQHGRSLECPEESGDFCAILLKGIFSLNSKPSIF